MPLLRAQNVGSSSGPASILAQRVASADATTVLVANGATIRRLKARYAPKEEAGDVKDVGVTPEPFDAVEATADWPLAGADPSQPGSSVESLIVRHVNGTAVTAAINGRGQIWQATGDDADVGNAAAFSAPAHTADHGWAGVDVHPASSRRIASARYFQRSLAVYTDGVCTRSAFLPNTPHRIRYLPSGLLCVVAGHTLLTWDSRIGENNGVVDRAKDSDEAAGSVGMGPRAFGPSGFAQVYSTGRLYALATADTTVAVAGEDRTVVVYDVRKWSSILGTWSSCLKNDASWLAFRDDDKRYCYVSGTVDSELACGSWDASLGRFGHLDNVSLRVDGRWIGTDKPAGSDVVFGVTASGSLYAVDRGAALFQRLHRLAAAARGPDAMSVDAVGAPDLKRLRHDAADL